MLPTIIMNFTKMYIGPLLSVYFAAKWQIKKKYIAKAHVLLFQSANMISDK